MSKFSKKLGQYNDMWKKGKDQGGDLPEGQYLLQLESATLRETKAGNLGISVKYLCVEGEYEGSTVSEFKNITSGKGPYFVAQWFGALGFDAPDDIEDIEDLLIEMADQAPIANCTVKVSGDFTNIYVNELDDSAPEDDDDDDDDEVEETAAFEDDD